ncbi:hypothetical protein M0804_015018 [Polistes exclamans]|nr:hypothetical protein M0804_015019 [Polistes exclamans]KAI4474101.1 hypothetical protein M0804_015018 [Polistes exclamans]
MQRAEMEELRQREANLTALQAIGPRKKPKLDIGGPANSPGNNSNLNTSVTGMNRQMPLRPRLKRGRNSNDPPDIWRPTYMVLCELVSMDLNGQCGFTLYVVSYGISYRMFYDDICCGSAL